MLIYSAFVRNPKPLIFNKYSTVRSCHRRVETFDKQECVTNVNLYLLFIRISSCYLTCDCTYFSMLLLFSSVSFRMMHELYTFLNTLLLLFHFWKQSIERNALFILFFFLT